VQILLLQVSNRWLNSTILSMYVGKNPVSKVKLRASRLGLLMPDKNPLLALSTGAMEPARLPNQLLKSAGADLYVLPETDLEEILRELESLKPNVAVIDSIRRSTFQP